MTPAKTLQICGTGSGVGKSVIVAGLCRIFLQDGFKVCPFKAQNMALNSFVTKEGGEIGRAQASQAAACRIEPSVDMNPILIKPTSDIGAQIVVRGRPRANMKAAEYIKRKKDFKGVVMESFARLRRAYDIVVIEGAGSPAEINLKRHDLVNMKMARRANAPVVLVGDIDKGGVFAWLVGTFELLSKEERKLVKGIIINKFRGDKSLLSPAVKFLERRLGVKVLGVVPYFKDIKIAEEDSVYLDEERPVAKRGTNKKCIDVAVIKLPHISNFTDFDALEKEGDVVLRYVKNSGELVSPDLIIIPGTKNTISDLKYLKSSGLAKKIISRIGSGRSAYLLGICGGYQMLGRKIVDKYHLESNSAEVEGLGLLPVRTHLAKDKVLSQVKAKDAVSGVEVLGYEIHHGLSGCEGGLKPFFEILEQNGKETKYHDGCRRKDGRVLGTYIHGLFDSDGFRREFLNAIRLSKGLRPLAQSTRFDPEGEFDRLARLLRENIDMKSLYGIMKVRSHGH